MIYFEDYIVVDPGSTPAGEGSHPDGKEYRNAEDAYGYDSFEAGMGAEAIQKMLASIDLATLVTTSGTAGNTNSKQNKRKIAKRLEVVDAFRQSGNTPGMDDPDVLPVIPPDLRPWSSWTAAASPRPT